MFSFPNPLNEKAARVVAGVVALAGVVVLATGAHWLLVPMAYGFWARVLTGPTLSPLGRLASGVIAPRLGPPKYVAGPPKRFAQGMGAAFTTSAAVLALGFRLTGAADVLVGLLVGAATGAGGRVWWGGGGGGRGRGGLCSGPSPSAARCSRCSCASGSCPRRRA